MEQTLIVKFRARGYLKYLSHHQSMEMFKRAMVRSQIELCYSGGFNPRPKLSLPLPRAVGISSDEELLRVSIVLGQGEDESDLCKRLSAQLPEGIEIDSLDLADSGLKLQPVSVVYEFCFAEPAGRGIHARVLELQKTLAAKEDIAIERKGTKKTKNVGCYIDAIDIVGSAMQVRCSVTPAGTIRIDEILRLFGIELPDTAIEVKRKSIEWKYN